MDELIARIKGTKVTVYHDQKEVTIDLEIVLRIDENNITGAFLNQASIYGYFAILQAEAERRVSITDMEKDQYYADTDLYMRKKSELAEKKPTEPQIKSMVLMDQDYQDALDRHAQAQEDLSTIKAIVNALKMRADMLISLGAHLRQEYSMTGMTVNQLEQDRAVDEVKEKLRARRK